MANPKRGGSFGHYDDHNSQPTKRSRTERPTYNTTSYDNHNGIGSKTPKSIQDCASHQRYNSGSAQPTGLTASQMRTGLVVLLDTFVQDETAPGGDGDILYHARELRRLLCAKMDPKAAETKRALDEKRPDKEVNVLIPDYIERRVRAAADLPSLPPIAEPHLHDAVFTHRSAHVNPGDPRHSHSFSLDIDYERLELLGDAYIELIASRALYNRFPHVDVPDLCSWRERLVENINLSKFSYAYDFPSRLKHKTNWPAGSKAWLKVSADIFEAYVAALVLADPENGFNIAEEWLTMLWAPQLLNFKETVLENPKARNELNKLIVAKDVKLTTQEERPMTYDENKIQCYYIGIYLTGWGYTEEWLGSGTAQNKAQAGIAAANDALKRNGPVIQDAARQKAELLDKKREENRKDQQEKSRLEKEAKNGVTDTSETVPELEQPDHHDAKDDSVPNGDNKKRKNEDPESPPVEKKKKKDKKEKKEKKEERKDKKEKKKKHKAAHDIEEES